MRNTNTGKRYGGVNTTSLRLTDKAELAYSSTSPLDIFEMPDGTFSLRGAIAADDWTQKDVIEALEADADESIRSLAEDEYREDAEDLCSRGLYDAAVELMDDTLREMIHADLAPCSDEAFLAAYMAAHWLRFGERFTVC